MWMSTGCARSLRRVAAAAALGAAMLTGIVSPTHGASAGLSATATVASGLMLSAQVRPGPYFADEALLVQISLRNTTKRTLVLEQPGLCRFAAQIVVRGQAVQGIALPPSPLCAGVGMGRLSLKPDGQVTGSVMAAVPVVTGTPGRRFTVQLRTSALFTVSGVPNGADPSVVSPSVTVPAVASGALSGGKPEQTLHATVMRNAQGFLIAVTDGRGKAVPGVTGWYVVQAPDGPLSWSVATPGQIICGPGCATSSQAGTYHVTVVLARDGYSVATAMAAYTVK